MRTKGLGTGAGFGEPGACGGRRYEVLWLERRRGRCGHGADRRKRRDVDTVPPRKARTVLQSGKEAKGPLVSQEVQEAHKFAVKAAGCRHNQGEKGLVVMTEVIRAIPVALRLRHGRVEG